MARSRPPGVTVVIPSWRRPEGLRRALRALAGQCAGGPWDVVVVASGADTAAHEVVAAERDRLLAGPTSSPSSAPEAAPALAPTSALEDVRVVDEPGPGSSLARNRGLAESRQVVAFLDDDCRPEPGWLRAITAPVQAGTAAGTGGRVVLDPTVPVPSWLGPALLSYLAHYDRGTEDIELGDDDFVLTANAAFDADLLAFVGGFDPLLGTTAGRPTGNEEIDVCRKVRRAGGTIAYTASAVVVHDLPASRLRPTYLLRRMHAQGRSDWWLDRGRWGQQGGAGMAEGLWSLWAEERAILRQGPWHPSVLLHSVGAAARTAGFSRQALGDLYRRRSSLHRHDGGRPDSTADGR